MLRVLVRSKRLTTYQQCSPEWNGLIWKYKIEETVIKASEDSDHQMKISQSTGETVSEKQVSDQRQGNRWFRHY